MRIVDVLGLGSLVLSGVMALYVLLPITKNEQYLPSTDTSSLASQATEITPVVEPTPRTLVKGETAPTANQVKETLTATSPLDAGPVAEDLASIGFNIGSLRSNGIDVIAHNGKIAKNCVSGPSQSASIEGIAVRKGVVYTPCPNGEQPLPDSYSAGEYRCFVHYNSSSPKADAILAHEVAHCLYFLNGEQSQFDLSYRNLRPELSNATTSNYREVMADDFMICYTGLDTDWSNSYHSRNGLSKPGAEFCAQFNEIAKSQLII